MSSMALVREPSAESALCCEALVSKSDLWVWTSWYSGKEVTFADGERA